MYRTEIGPGERLASGLPNKVVTVLARNWYLFLSAHTHMDESYHTSIVSVIQSLQVVGGCSITAPFLQIATEDNVVHQHYLRLPRLLLRPDYFMTAQPWLAVP